MARGGKRAGTPGKSYAQRTDLHQAVKVAPGQPYGQAKALADAQKVVPLPNTQNVPAPAAPPVVGAGGPAATPTAAGPGPVMLPGQQPFARPTDRPDEPVTAGLPSGPGPGPDALGANAIPPMDIIGAQLKALYQIAPNDDLLRVMALHETQSRP